MSDIKTILLQFAVEHAWYLALGVISLLLSRRSQVDAWAEQNPRIAGVMKALRALGLDPWMFVQSLSLIVRKKLPEKPSTSPKPTTGAAALVLALALAPGMVSCASGPTKPVCAPEQLAKIEVAFVAEATEACAGKTIDTCEALPAIREKYAAKRKEWVNCQ